METSKILVDADVIIHLYKCDQLSLLQQLFPKRILILDVVYSELIKNPTINTHIQNLITFKQAQLIDFPTNDFDILKEYNQLKRSKGLGESACMAVCRFQKNILASSNMRDIGPYCRTHSIKYLTTMDIFAIAYKKGLLTVAECDHSIYQIKSKGSNLIKAIDRIEDYFIDDFEDEKLTY